MENLYKIVDILNACSDDINNLTDDVLSEYRTYETYYKEISQKIENLKDKFYEEYKQDLKEHEIYYNPHKKEIEIYKMNLLPFRQYLTFENDENFKDCYKLNDSELIEMIQKEIKYGKYMQKERLKEFLKNSIHAISNIQQTKEEPKKTILESCGNKDENICLSVNRLSYNKIDFSIRTPNMKSQDTYYETRFYSSPNYKGIILYGFFEVHSDNSSGLKDGDKTTMEHYDIINFEDFKQILPIILTEERFKLFLREYTFGKCEKEQAEEERKDEETKELLFYEIYKSAIEKAKTEEIDIMKIGDGFSYEEALNMNIETETYKKYKACSNEINDMYKTFDNTFKEEINKLRDEAIEYLQQYKINEAVSTVDKLKEYHKKINDKKSMITEIYEKFISCYVKE